jgi:hypothetical protein
MAATTRRRDNNSRRFPSEAPAQSFTLGRDDRFADSTLTATNTIHLLNVQRLNVEKSNVEK